MSEEAKTRNENPEEDRSGREGPDGETIDAGDVTEFEELRAHRAHRAVTTQRLAFLLVWIMAITVAVHYGGTVVLHLTGNDKAAEGLQAIFNAWLPVISGLVGGAATYYFTREK